MGVFQRLRDVAIGRTHPARRHHINNARPLTASAPTTPVRRPLILAADNPLSMLISACFRRISCR